MQEVLERQRQDEINRRNDWRQTVSAQHTVIATLAGLQVTALTLFTALRTEEPNASQKSFFIISLIFLVVIVGCLLFIAEHERKDAYDSSKVTSSQRVNENKVRITLNFAVLLNSLAIATLLIISYI